MHGKAALVQGLWWVCQNLNAITDLEPAQESMLAGVHWGLSSAHSRLCFSIPIAVNLNICEDLAAPHVLSQQIHQLIPPLAVHHLPQRIGSLAEAWLPSCNRQLSQPFMGAITASLDAMNFSDSEQFAESIVSMLYDA